MTTYIFDLAHFFLEWEMSEKIVVEKIKTHILCLIALFRKSRRLRDNVEKFCTAVHVTDDNMAHAHCMPDTQDHENTLRIYNTYCSPTATMVARTRPNVTLYVYCMSCNAIPPSPLYFVRLSRLKTTVKRRTFRAMVTQWSGYDFEKIGALWHLI